jgi:hypothetical protein
VRVTLPILLALLFASPAAATEIDLIEIPTVGFKGRALRVGIELVDPEEDIKQLTLRGDPSLQVKGPFSQGRSVRVVNGKQSVSFPVHWEVTPTRAGRFALGQITVVTTSGKTQQQTLSGELRVLEPAPPGTNTILIKALAGGPVGYPFRVQYTLLTAEDRFEGRGTFGDARFPFGLEGLQLSILRTGLSWVPFKADPNAKATELRLGKDETLLVQTSIVEWKGHGYFATLFGVEVTPRAPGQLNLLATASLQVVGGTKRIRDFFGRVQDVPSGKKQTVVSAPATYRVADLPAGKPKGFTGAVGRYTISASCSAREANAFDPIEVTIRVEGIGLLDDVVLPPWQTFEEISTLFQVATDVDPGKLVDNAKVFTKVFRAKSAHVTALPSLPFPYFDPKSGRYVVAKSAPVPLTIHEVKTVTAADAVGGGTGPTPSGSGGPMSVVAREGIGANYVTLGDERETLEAPTRFGALLIAAAIMPPAAWLLLLVLPWLKARGAKGPTALAEALATAAPGTLEAIRASLQNYVTRRLGLGGEVTPGELEQALRARVVPPETIERVVAFWGKLESARFSGGGDVPPGVAAILSDLDGAL